MGHVPMGTTDSERCVERIQCPGSPPPSSNHHRDRTRTLVSWDPRHIVTPLPSQTPNENHKSTNITIRDRWMTSVKTRRTNTNLPWGGGSRQCSVERYIYGSQPRVQKRTSSRGSRGEKPQDVITQTQVSRKVEGPTVKEGVGIVEGETETGRWIDHEEDRKGCRRDTSRNHTGVRGGKTR